MRVRWRRRSAASRWRCSRRRSSCCCSRRRRRSSTSPGTACSASTSRCRGCRASRASATTRRWAATRASGIRSSLTGDLHRVDGRAAGRRSACRSRCSCCRSRAGQGILRVAAILPIVLAPVVVGLFWRTLVLAPDFGLVDLVTRALGPRQPQLARRPAARADLGDRDPHLAMDAVRLPRAARVARDAAAGRVRGRAPRPRRAPGSASCTSRCRSSGPRS